MLDLFGNVYKNFFKGGGGGGGLKCTVHCALRSDNCHNEPLLCTLRFTLTYGASCLQMFMQCLCSVPAM